MPWFKFSAQVVSQPLLIDSVFTGAVEVDITVRAGFDDRVVKGADPRVHGRDIVAQVGTAMMRLYYLSGDRTRALRQYERCVEFLEVELGVRPSISTKLLYDQILSDKLNSSADPSMSRIHIPQPEPVSLPTALGYFQTFQALLEDMQRQLQHEIQSIERDMNHQ